MKKKKNLVIIIVVIIGIILIDSIQALVFDNRPLFKISVMNDGSVIKVHKGILVDTYHCPNGKKDTVIKGFSYSCSISLDYEIIDTSRSIKDFVCAEALEEIYEDDNYVYYLSCIKSSYIKVRYKNAHEENIIQALQSGHINIQDLDKFNIDYLKYEK